MNRGMIRSAVAVGIVLGCVEVPRADAARDLAVDLSHFQGETGMPQANWNQLAAEGRTFAFIKATEGLLPPGNIDPAWQTNVQRATTAGLLNGVYHLARPDNRPTVAGAVAEADQFVTTASAAMAPGHLRPVLDLEKGFTLGTSVLSDWVVAFNDEVVRLKGADAEPIVYCGSSYATLLDSRMTSYDLWLASQTNPADPTTANPSLSSTGSFGNWAFWQYSGTGTAGGISPIDLDVVHAESHSLSSFVITPEPAGAALLLACAASAVLARRRRRSVTAS